MTTPTPNQPSQKTATPAAHQRECCRYIKSDGHPCRGLALRSQLYCHCHGRDLRRYHGIGCDTPLHIPRLDNRADIQQVVTDVSRALVAGVIEHRTAYLLLAATRVASAQLPPPRAARVSDQDAAPPVLETVEEVFPGPHGQDLAPPAPYHGPNGVPPEPRFDLGAFLYRKIFPEHDSEPLPAEGFPTPEDLKNPHAFQKPESHPKSENYLKPEVYPKQESTAHHPHSQPGEAQPPQRPIYPGWGPEAEWRELEFLSQSDVADAHATTAARNGDPAPPTPENQPANPKTLILDRVQARAAKERATHSCRPRCKPGPSTPKPAGTGESKPVTKVLPRETNQNKGLTRPPTQK